MIENTPKETWNKEIDIHIGTTSSIDKITRVATQKGEIIGTK